MMNYKPTSAKGEKLTTEQVANFLKVNKKNEGDVYDDIMYYDDAKIKVFFYVKKELVLRQTFLIAKGYFDPKEYFQAIKIDNLDDQTFDNKIRSMFNWFLFHFISFLYSFLLRRIFLIFLFFFYWFQLRLIFFRKDNEFQIFSMFSIQ